MIRLELKAGDCGNCPFRRSEWDDVDGAVYWCDVDIYIEEVQKAPLFPDFEEAAEPGACPFSKGSHLQVLFERED